MPRIQVTDEQLQEVVGKIMYEIAMQIKRKGSRGFVSPHECLGVIMEEIHELTDATILNERGEIRAELLDVAVAAIWSLASEEAGGWGTDE